MSDFSPFDDLIALLKQNTELTFSVEKPFKPDGDWWLDLSIDGRQTAIVWRSRLGFGLFTSEDVFGQRPDEVFSDVVKAANRIRQIARHRAADETLTMTLRDLRSLVGKTQENLAELLATGQAEISRLEARDDTHIDRFRGYVEALGGKLELMVVFPDFRGPVSLPSPRDVSAPASASRGRKKSHA